MSPHGRCIHITGIGYYVSIALASGYRLLLRVNFGQRSNPCIYVCPPAELVIHESVLLPQLEQLPTRAELHGHQIPRKRLSQ